MSKQDASRKGAYLPATFAQRGVAVAFTTPVLSFARLRKAKREGLEFLVPGLAGGAETYVIPAANIGDVVVLTVFDRLLTEAFHDEDIDLSPLNMRTLALTKSTSGLAGAKAAQRARDLLAEDEKNKAAMIVLLTQRAVDQLSGDGDGDGAHEISLATLASGEALETVDKALKTFAQDANLTAAEIFANLETWAALASVVGSPDGQVVGPLQLLILDLERLSAELSKWLVPEPVSPAEMAQRIAATAKLSVAEARKILAFVDEPFKDMGPPLKNWPGTEASIHEAVRRISDILDGWRRIVNMWDRVARMERIDQRETVELFGLYMPVLPIDAAGDNTAFWEDLRATQQRWDETSTGAASALLDIDDKIQDKLHKYTQEVA